MNTKLTALIDENRLVQVTRDLVRIPSVNPPGGEKPVAEYLLNQLASWGIEAELIPEPDPNRPQVLARLRGNGTRPPLLLNGHMDVVPTGDPSRWEFPPFSGTIKNGRLYGRGSSDMKGGLSVALEVCRVIHTAGIPLSGDLALPFAMGEETGEPGTQTLLERSGYRDGFAIVLEPTGLSVCVAGRGLAWFRITIEGKSTHASIAEQGINPIDMFLSLGPAITKYNEKIRQRRHPLCGSATCAMTMVHAGEKENVTPETLSLVLDRRINPGEKVENVQQEIEDLLVSLAESDKNFHAHLELIHQYEPAEIPPDISQVSLLCRSVEQATGEKAVVHGAPFSTDARNFINDVGIPAVVFGPGEMNQPHTLDESIRVSDLTAATRAILNVADKLILNIS